MTMPYGTRTDVRTTPRQKIVRCITRASPMPRTSSIVTDTAVMNSVTQKASHQNGEDSTAP